MKPDSNPARIAVRSAAGAAILLAQAACVTATSTVSEKLGAPFSVASGPWQSGTGDNRGLTYFLPTRLVTLEITTIGKDLNQISDNLKKATAAQATAEEASKAATKKQNDLQAKLDELQKPPAGAAETIAQVKKELEIAKAEASIAKRALASKNGEVEILEAQLRVATNTPSEDCIHTATIKTGVLAPDTRRIFRLNPSHSWLRDDKGTLKTNTNGLLSSTNITATDRTGEILVEFAGASAAGKGVNILERGPKKCAAIPPFSMIFDPVGVNELDATSGINKALLDKEFPYRVGLRTLADASVVRKHPDPILPPAGEIPGVAYRVEVPMLLALYETKSDQVASSKDLVLANATLVSLPQAGPVGFIPMRSSAFVERVNEVEFENGMLKSWNYSRPSEALEFVRLPVKVAKAIISIPAELLSLKVDYSSKEIAQAEKAKQELELQLKTERLMACVAAAGTDAEAAAACIK